MQWRLLLDTSIVEVGTQPSQAGESDPRLRQGKWKSQISSDIHNGRVRHGQTWLQSQTETHNRCRLTLLRSVFVPITRVPDSHVPSSVPLPA